MSAFTITAESALPVQSAWDRLVDWPAHARFVPFTTIRVVTPPPNGVGTRFVARTAVRRYGFDDPMVITAWTAPTDGGAGECRIEKRGRMLGGWAVLRVEPRGAGSLASWTEDIEVRRLPHFVAPATTLSSRLLFRRVLRELLADQNC